jgi:pilus assembly protein Flp/PilA
MDNGRFVCRSNRNKPQRGEAPEISDVLNDSGRIRETNPLETRMKEKVLRFLHDEDGMTSVEYAVAGALITAAVVAAFVGLGEQVEVLINSITNAIP